MPFLGRINPPLTTFAPGTTLPSANEARDAVPVASGRGKIRCRMHGGAAGSGAPKGNRNGKYRHGGFIRNSRDFLSRLR